MADEKGKPVDYSGQEVSPGWVTRPSFMQQAFMDNQDAVYDLEKQALEQWYQNKFPKEYESGQPYTAQMALANISSPEDWEDVLARASQLGYDVNPWLRESWLGAVSNTYGDNVSGVRDPGFFDYGTGRYNMDTMGDVYDYDMATRPTLPSVLRGGPESWTQGVGKTSSVFGDDMAKTLAYYGYGYKDMDPQQAFELLQSDPNAFYGAMPDAITRNWIDLQGATAYSDQSMDDWERGRSRLRGEDNITNDFLDPRVQGFDASTFSQPEMVRKLQSGSAGAAPSDAASSGQSPTAASSTESGTQRTDATVQSRIQALSESGLSVEQIIEQLQADGTLPSGATSWPSNYSYVSNVLNGAR